MDTEQILKVLKNERECIKRQNGKCDRNCKDCDLCLPDTEILEVYDFLINAYSMTEVHIQVSPEEADKLIEILNRNANEGVRLAAIGYPVVGTIYPTFTFETEEAKADIRKSLSEVGYGVAERERKFREGDEYEFEGLL